MTHIHTTRTQWGAPAHAVLRDSAKSLLCLFRCLSRHGIRLLCHLCRAQLLTDYETTVENMIFNKTVRASCALSS